MFTNGKLYGYSYDTITNSLIAIPDEAAVVRLIFDLYEKKMGLRRIAQNLEENGFKTRKGMPFFKTTIRRILANEKYAGLNNPQKYDKGKVFEKSYTIKINAKYIVEPSDRIEAIITKDQFYRCKKILEASVNYKSSVGKYTGVSKYNGLIYCAHCKAVYYSNVDRGRRYYLCSTKKKYGAKSCEEAKNINETILDQRISELMSGEYKRMVDKLGNNLLVSFYENLRTLIERSRLEDDTEIFSTNEEILKEEEKQRRLYILFIEKEDIDNDIILKDMIAQNRKKIQELKDRRIKLQDPKKAIQDDLKLLLESISEVQQFLSEPSPATESDMIDRLKRIDIYKGMTQYSIKLPETLKKYRERFGDEVYVSGQPVTPKDMRNTVDLAKQIILGNVS